MIRYAVRSFVPIAALLVCVVSMPAQTAPVAPAAETHARGDIAGDWQGTLQAGKALRLILRIAKSEKGWTAKFYSIDQGGQAFNANRVTLDGSAFQCTIDLIGGSYAGTLSGDGNTIAGTWSQGGSPLPLTLVRATKDTAWEIPAPAPPPKLMAADADPSFEVATIKPNDSGATSMRGLVIDGRNFRTRASSLGDLIAFAYNVQAKQVVNGPEWMDKDRYDIDAVPDVEGAPNTEQVRVMIRKLLADRFKLTFHHEKRELSAFVLTAGKAGPKLTPTQLNGPLPGIGMRPGPTGLTFNIANGTLDNFCGFLQMLVLDRPVVNQTGLTAKYDFQMTFTPDESEFNGHPPMLNGATHAEGVEAAPGLFQAIQQQLGLKLEAQKTAVDVLAIDHVERPSAN
jgi:uncharacterized protein (TIGR03435 family)